jgi:hypothetical protein
MACKVKLNRLSVNTPAGTGYGRKDLGRVHAMRSQSLCSPACADWLNLAVYKNSHLLLIREHVSGLKSGKRCCFGSVVSLVVVLVVVVGFTCQSFSWSGWGGLGASVRP